MVRRQLPWGSRFEADFHAFAFVQCHVLWDAMLCIAASHQPGLALVACYADLPACPTTQAAIKDKFPDIKQVQFAED